MLEAENLFKAGVKELLVISQDTSAYGVDIKFRMGFWNGKPVKTHMTQLVESLGELAKQYDAWVRLHYVYPYPHVDQIIPFMNNGHVLPYLDVPLQHAHPDVLKRMKRPASGEKTLSALRHGAKCVQKSPFARLLLLASQEKPRKNLNTCWIF